MAQSCAACRFGRGVLVPPMQTPRRSFGYRIYIGHGRAASVLLTVHFFSSGEEFFMRASTGGNLQSAIRNPQSAIRNWVAGEARAKSSATSPPTTDFHR